MKNLKKEVLELIKGRGDVTFLELSKIDGFKGDLDYCSELNENVYFWSGISDDGVAVLEQLRNEGLITASPTSHLVYLIDGGGLNLPLPKTLKTNKKSWVPMVFNVT